MPERLKYIKCLKKETIDICNMLISKTFVIAEGSNGYRWHQSEKANNI